MTENTEKYLRVIDSSVTELNKHRIHEIVINGTILTINFVYGEDTILPFEQGIKFMKDGFTVEEVDGKSLNLPAVPTENVAAQLKDDECVAKFTELTTSSLLLRAAQKTGGEIYLNATDSDRDDVIAFIRGIAPVNLVSEDETLIELEEGDDIVDPDSLVEEGNDELTPSDLAIAEYKLEAEVEAANTQAAETTAEEFAEVTEVEVVGTVETVADESQSEEIVQNEVGVVQGADVDVSVITESAAAAE